MEVVEVIEPIAELLKRGGHVVVDRLAAVDLDKGDLRRDKTDCASTQQALSSSEYEHLGALHVELQDVDARQALTLRERVECRDVNLDSLEAVHVPWPDDGADVVDGSQQRVRRGRREGVKCPLTGCVRERKPVEAGSRVRAEPFTQLPK